MRLPKILFYTAAIWSGITLLAALLLGRGAVEAPLSALSAGSILVATMLLLTAEAAVAVAVVAAVKAGLRGSGPRRMLRILGLSAIAAVIILALMASIVSWNLYTHGFSFITLSTFVSTVGDIAEIGPFFTLRETLNLACGLAAAGLTAAIFIRAVPPAGAKEIVRMLATAAAAVLMAAILVRMVPRTFASPGIASRIEAVFQARTYPGAMLWWHDLIYLELEKSGEIQGPLVQRYEVGDYLAQIDTGVPRKNVLIFSIESLRAEELFNAPDGREVMPTTNNLARQGVYFSRAYSPGNESLYSMTAAVSGLECLKSRRRDKFRNLDYPLARIFDLASKTHHTAFISSSNEEWQGMINVTRSPLLDYFFNANNYSGRALPVSRADSGMSKALAAGKLKNTTLDDSITTGELIAWIDSALAAPDHRPFFATAVFQSSHYPYQQGFDVPEFYSPAGFTEEETASLSFFEYPEALTPRMLNRYYNSLAFDDSLIAKVIEHLRAAGELERTIVVIFGDHGEMFHENGSVTHASKLYDKTIRPLFVVSGLNSPVKGEYPAAVGLIDIGPLLLAALQLPPYGGFQGQVPGGLLPGDPAAPDTLRPLYSTVQNVSYEDAVTAGRWKYAAESLGPGERLFNLNQDPLERTNLLTARPAQAQCLRKTLEQFRRNQLTYYESNELKKKFFAPKTGLSEAWCDRAALSTD